jgi:tetratricopeptide (TPR) repeat protein
VGSAVNVQTSWEKAVKTKRMLLFCCLVLAGCEKGERTGDTDKAIAYYDRGNASHNKGEYDKAIADYDEAIRLDPKYAIAYCNRGSTWLRKGDTDKAIADYDEAIRLDPNLAMAYYHRGLAWDDESDTDKAIADFDESIRLDPNNVHHENALAWLFATCPDEKYRDGQKAVEHATKACELTDWKEPGWIDTLAAANAEASDFEKAVKWQQKAMEMADESEKADYKSRLDLYEAGKPYRVEPKE